MIKKTTQTESKKNQPENNPDSFGGLEPSFPNISLDEEILKSEDALAALIGNVPDMETLIAKAKSGDKKALFALIKIHSNKHLVVADDSKQDTINPYIFIDDEFITQAWVQELLHKNIKDKFFQKDLWDAVISKLTHKWIQRTKDKQADLKRYIVFCRDAWNNDLKLKQITYEDIDAELRKNNLLESGKYGDLQSLRKFLGNYGVGGGRSGRPKKRK